MKKTILATTILAFTAAPALAQSSDAGSNTTTTGQSNMTNQSDTSGTTTSGANATSGVSNMSAEDMVASQEKVLDALKSAGYKDASIMDAAYLVGATTPDGEQVVMMIDTSGRVMGAQRQGAQSGQPGQNQQSNMSSDSGPATATDGDDTMTGSTMTDDGSASSQ